jgi:uncharacterized membrane protein YqjE
LLFYDFLTTDFLNSSKNKESYQIIFEAMKNVLLIPFALLGLIFLIVFAWWPESKKPLLKRIVE